MQKKFKSFLESLKRVNNKSILEAILKGYTLLESNNGKYIGYHGTNEKFDTFDISKTGYVGFFFAPDKDNHVIYRSNYIITAELTINNPAPLDLVSKIYEESMGGNPRRMAHDRLKKMGYDGIIRPVEYLVFDESQIKVLSIDNSPEVSHEKLWGITESIGPVYHGTDEKFDKFNLDKTAEGVAWFTDKKEDIESGESGAEGTKYILERYLDIPENKLANWDQYDKHSLGELVNMGYKGVKLTSGDENTYIVFDVNDIKKPKGLMESIGPVYHGTGSDIKEFKYEYTNQGNDQLGSGFYFTNYPDEAARYVDMNKDKNEKHKPNVIKAYLDIKNPLDATAVGDITYEQAKKIILMSPNLEDGLSNWGDVEYEGKEKVLNTAVKEYVINNDNILKGLHPFANDFYGDNVREFNEVIRKVLGYDGVFQKNDKESALYEKGTIHYVAWFPEQIKIIKGNS